MGGKLLNGIKSLYVNSLVCVRVKRGESECFRINRSVSCPLGSSMYMIMINPSKQHSKAGLG